MILVDGGLVTGSTMRAAVAALRQQQPAYVTVAVPIAAPEACEELRAEVDEIVCAVTPEPFYAVGLWYRDFSQTTDREVRELLARAARRTEECGTGASHARASWRRSSERKLLLDYGGDPLCHAFPPRLLGISQRQTADKPLAGASRELFQGAWQEQPPRRRRRRGIKVR